MRPGSIGPDWHRGLFFNFHKSPQPLYGTVTLTCAVERPYWFVA